MPKWTIFEISIFWKHQCLCFHDWDFLMNIWHNNWQSIIDVVENLSIIVNFLPVSICSGWNKSRYWPVLISSITVASKSTITALGIKNIVTTFSFASTLCILALHYTKIIEYSQRQNIALNFYLPGNMFASIFVEKSIERIIIQVIVITGHFTTGIDSMFYNVLITSLHEFPNLRILKTKFVVSQNGLLFANQSRAVASGGGLSSQVFGRTVNPISTRGQIMPTTVLQAPHPLRRPCRVCKKMLR